MSAMELELCNQFEDLDCENNQPQYFAGFYNIYKNGNTIFTYYFILDNVRSNEDAETEIWNVHNNDFNKNRFSELNQCIGNMGDIEIEIFESHFFGDSESYKTIESSLQDNLVIYRESYKEQGDNVQKNRKDNYNMNDLGNALDEAMMMDDLFGEEEE